MVYVLDLADRLISKAGPFAAAGIMVGSIYWTAVTYGAVTVMQVRPMQIYYFYLRTVWNNIKNSLSLFGCDLLVVVVVLTE